MTKKQRNFHVYSTECGVQSINSPMKIRILEHIQNRESILSDLAKSLKKAKSTLSIHLQELEEKGIIESKTHPQDKRKKTYQSVAQLLESSDQPEPKIKKKLREHVKKSIGNAFEFNRTVCVAVRYELGARGINVNPVLKSTGRQIGTEVAETMKSDSLEDLINEIGKFWRDHRLGKMRTQVKEKDATLFIEDCYNCSDMPNVEKPLCSLDEGMLEGILEGRLGVKADAKEIECWGTGAKHCRFKVTIS